MLGLVTLALSGAGWWLTVTSGPSDDLTVPFCLQLGTFAGATVVAVLWRMRVGPGSAAATRPGRTTASARRERSGATARTGHHPFPPRGLWLLPLAELVLFAPALPVAYAHDPGDPTVVGLLFVYALVLGWAAISGSLVVSFLLVLPVLVVLRPLWLLLRRAPLTAERLLASASCLMWLAFVGTVVGAVVGTPTRGGRGDLRQLGALVGLGEVTSPSWIWFGRASLAVLVLGGLVVFALLRRSPRNPDVGGDAPRTDAAAPAVPNA